MTTRASTRGGVGSYLRTMQATPLWARWGIDLVSTHRDGSAAQKVLEFLTGVGTLLARVVVRRPAVVHLHMASNGSFLRKSVIVAICRAVRVPVVLHVHGGGFDEFHRSLPAPLRSLVRTTLSGAATVVALGPRWAARLHEIAPEARIVVVPNAVAVPATRSRAGRDGRPDVVFLGDVTAQKGVFVLLEAWAALRPTADRARLVVAGTGELDLARRTARDLGIDSSVDIRGWVSDVPALLDGAQVLVLPSLVEGQPMAVLEAMARGLCVVASDVGGVPDLVEHGVSGLLVPPGDVEALAATLRRVLGDPLLRDSLGSGALRRARENFDVDVVWRRIDALYHQILSDPARTGSRPKGTPVNDLPPVPQLQSERDDVRLFEAYIRGCEGDRPVEILEAGCGRRWSLGLDGLDFRLTGIDADRAALEIRRDVRRDMDVAIVGDLSTVELADESFDVVYNSFVMEHVQDADRVLGNFARWLRPGGVMLLRFPDRHSVRGFVTRFSPHWVHVLYYRLVLKYPGAGKPGFPPYPVVYHPTVSREGIRRFCAEHGLTMREEWGDGQHLLLGGKVTERLTKAAMRLFAAFTAGRLTARHTNLLYVIEKAAPGTDVTTRPAGAPERSRPVRLDVVLDTAAVGGVETQLLQLFAGFDRSTVVPRLVCLREPGPLADRFRALGVDVDVVSGASALDPRRLSRLVSSMRARGTDVVLTVHHQRAALMLGRVAARLAGIPDVVAVHDMDRVAVGDRCLPRPVVETLASSAALVLLAEGQGRYLAEHEGVGRRPWRRTRQVVIPNGIRLPDPPTAADRSAARERLGLTADDLVVGIVARLSPQKAHEVLLRAVARLAAAHPRLTLVVVGDGPRAAELRDRAEVLGIADRVRFTGTRDDVPDLLPGFDVAALSSIHEGAPITVIEAMAAGLPVVATRCGALPDMITDGEEGYLVPVGDDAALARRIGELVADEALRAELGARGRKRAERDFRAEDMVARYEDLLTGLVAR